MWIRYSPDDPAWLPDRSPDKSRSLRWTDAPEGVLVCVSDVVSATTGNVQWLPGVFLRGRWLDSERAYQDIDVAKRKAVEIYNVNARW